MKKNASIEIEAPAEKIWERYSDTEKAWEKNLKKIKELVKE
jgi:hypothetical protein